MAEAIELAKVSTLKDSKLSAQTSESIRRLSRKQQKQLQKTFKRAMKNPQCLNLHPRNRQTDFVTHFKFVLNRCIDMPCSNRVIPLFLSVLVAWGKSVDATHRQRLAVTSETRICDLGQMISENINMTGPFEYRTAMMADPGESDAVTITGDIEYFDQETSRLTIAQVSSSRVDRDLSGMLFILIPTVRFANK